jgi:protein-disulfide isomerase
VVGKLVGIGAGALGAARLGWGTLPQGVGNGHVWAGGALSGIGFTVSLLIASLAFDDERIRDEATVGVLLAAVVASVVGWLLFRVAAKNGQGDAALPMYLSDPVDPAVDHVKGGPDAELTLVEYLDYECPFCARATGSAEEVRAHFGDRLRYVPRHLPLAVHPHAEKAAVAVEAAGRQGRFWEMHELLFRRQDRLAVEHLVDYAAELGLDVDEFVSDLGDDALAERVWRDVESAEASGVRGTPTFFIGDRRHTGPFDARTLIAELERSQALR